MSVEMQTWVIVVLAIYLVVWFVLVKIVQMMSPTDDDEWKDYCRDKEIPYINIRTMVCGLSALWILWLAIGILYLCYKGIKWVISLFR